MNESIKDRFLKEHALTDEQLKQVSGGLEEPKIIATFSCPGDCNGTNALTCQVSPCPHGRKHITIFL